ncbi:MAG: N-acetylglucosamine-6-phosphate deacetylase [Acidobacteria bacterium]|nr:N-acetylglucosamine-6-phosphate deacetylase [Acidobacteriota bacterium]
MRIRGKIGTGEEIVDLSINAGRIDQISPASPAQKYDFGGEDLRIGPGLIDIQINGYDSVDFNNPQTGAEEIAETASRLLATGVIAFCPTLITNSAVNISKCIANLLQTADEYIEFNRAMLGIHVEGPYISPEDGPRGAHPRQHVRPPNWDEFQQWQEHADGRIRIVTLSPEWPESLDFIERATEAGVIVAIGHTSATSEQIDHARSAGAKLSTHLGNGSHAKIDRHQNYLWQQLAADELWASFIVDGHHLPPSVVKCFLRCKSTRRSILVTDAIAAAGRPPGRYYLGEVAVEVTSAGRVCLPGTPYLAGSALEMDQAIAKTVQFSDASLDQAWQMASVNPAKLLGISERFGSIEVVREADIVLFRWDDTAKTIEVVATIVNGVMGFQEERLRNKRK